MSRLITLGLLALSLGLFSQSLLAGNADGLCGHLKKGNAGSSFVPGLYGLCTAYNNEDDPDAREDIAANYLRKSGGETVPGYTPPPVDEEVVLQCPCWAGSTLDGIATHLDDLGALTTQCSLTDTYGNLVFVGSGQVIYYTLNQPPAPVACQYIDPAGGVGFVMVTLTVDQVSLCLDELHDIADENCYSTAADTN